MKIPIQHKGKTYYALVDKEDFDRLSKIRWYLVKGYAKTHLSSGNGGSNYLISIPMHSFITNTYGIGVNGNLETDHINGNKLDNRRKNLRSCTRSQNIANRTLKRNNKTGYKGVSNSKGGFQVTIAGSYVGWFKDKIEAAKAYDSKAKELYGDFAKTNF